MAGHLAGAVHRRHRWCAGRPDQEKVIVGCLHRQIGHWGRVLTGQLQQKLRGVQRHTAVRDRVALDRTDRQSSCQKQRHTQHKCANAGLESLLHGLCPPCLFPETSKYSYLRIILHAEQNMVKFLGPSAGQLSLILWRIIKSAFQFCTKRRRTRQTGCGGAVLLLNFPLSS